MHQNSLKMEETLMNFKKPPVTTPTKRFSFSSHSSEAKIRVSEDLTSRVSQDLRKSSNTVSTEPTKNSLNSSPVDAFPFMQGFVYRQGYIFKWTRRYITLRNRMLKIGIRKGGVQKNDFQITANCRCEDSKLRPFCFSITDFITQKSVVYAANNVSEKEAWMESIQTTIALIHLQASATRGQTLVSGSRQTALSEDFEDPDYIEQARAFVLDQKNQYSTRPLIYVKVVEIRNLIMSLDLHGVYVKVTLGASTVETTIRMYPDVLDWGMVFPFDWDRNMRFLKLEVFSVEGIKRHESPTDLIGFVLIPVYSMQEGNSSHGWYPLCKQSRQSSCNIAQRGEIQLEISCFGKPDESQHAWHFFREVQRMPEFRLSLASTIDGSGQIALVDSFQKYGEQPLSATNTVSTSTSGNGNTKDNGVHGWNRFPLFFPSIELETLEDVSIHAHILLGVEVGAVPGVFLLTNYRVLFVSIARITMDRNDNDKDNTKTPKLGESTQPYTILEENMDISSLKSELSTVDLTTAIPICAIVDIEVIAATGAVEAYAFSKQTQKRRPPKYKHDEFANCLRVTAADGRIIVFAFRNDSHGTSSGFLHNTITKLSDGLRKSSLDRNRQISWDGGLPEHSSHKSGLIPMSKLSSIREESLGISSTTTVPPWRSSTSTVAPGRVTPKRRSIFAFESAASVSDIEKATMSPLQVRWVNLSMEQNYLIEGWDSPEGPPALRIYTRVKCRCQNRDVEQSVAVAFHGTLLDTIRRAVARSQDSVAQPDTKYQSSSTKQRDPKDFRIHTEDMRIMQYSPGAASELNNLPLGWTAPNKGKSNANEKQSVSLPSRQNIEEGTDTDTTIENRMSYANKCDTEDEIYGPERAPGSSPHNSNNSSNLSTLEAIDNLTKDEWERISECTTVGLEQKIVESDVLSNVFTKLLYNFDNSWRIYDPYRELQRQGILLANSNWRITEINRNYQLCPTYPSVVAVPQSCSDDMLFKASHFRSKKRLPVLSWRSRTNNCTICRSSQPLVGISNNRSPADEMLLKHIQMASKPSTSTTSTTSVAGGAMARESIVSPMSSTSNSTVIDDINTVFSKTSVTESTAYDGDTVGSNLKASGFVSDRPYMIVDARPLLNAKANQAIGKGTELERFYGNVSISFMDIPNIHVVRKSMEMLKESLVEEASWLKNLEASGWLSHIRKIMGAASKITHYVSNQNLSILVHCSDGWDRTAQLTSLSMLFLDDYYRTIEGFIVLIEKEWVSFGHKFADRQGWSETGWKDEERSPIFQQWLDCVHQCLIQLPDAFEFNLGFLFFIMQHLTSGWFGNFLFNSEQELRVALNGGDLDGGDNWAENSSMFSIWVNVFANRSKFENPHYRSQKTPLIPVITKTRLVVWSDWYMNWYDRLWKISWLDENEPGYFDDTHLFENFGTTGTTDDLNSEDQINQESDGEQRECWVPNKNVAVCTNCELKFSLFKRKHHCRCCGQIFCEQCTSVLKIIPVINRFRPVRCCLECSRMIDHEEIDTTRRATGNKHTHN